MIVDCTPEAGLIGKLEEECHFHDAVAEMREVGSLDFIWDNSSSEDTNNQSYLYDLRRNYLFILSDAVFTVQDLSNLNKSQSANFINKCPKAMTFDFEKSKLFIFSCNLAFELSLEGVTLSSPPTMKPVFTNKEDLDISYARTFNDLIFLVSKNKGIQVFAIDVGGSLQLIKQISTIGSDPINLADLHYSEGRLLILDKVKGVQFFTRLNN